jgi:PAS domain S-box-containing protein
VDRLTLQGLLEALPDAAGTLGADGCVELANGRLGSQLGLPIERIQGRRFDEWVPAARAAFEERLAGCLAREPGYRPPPLDIVLLAPGAPAVPVEATLSRLPGEAVRVLVCLRDLREQRRAAERLEGRVAQRTAELEAAIRSLQQSEARHQALLAAVPDLVLRVAGDGTYLDVWSPQGTAFAGVERRVGWNVRGALPAEAAEIGMAAVRRAIETGGPVSHEYTLPVGDEPRHFEGRSARSGPDEVVIVIRDITERKRSEEALRLSERRLRQVIDLVPHFVFAKDAEGRFILANQAVADAYGTRVEKLLGRTDADFARSPEEARRFREDDLDVIRRGRSKLVPEELITDAGGRVRSLQTIKIPFAFSGTNAPAVLGVATDITDLKRAERALRASEERYRDLFENATDVICTFDLEGRFTSVNRKGELLSGYGRDELLRLPLSRIVAPPELAAARENLRQRLKGEPSPFEVEIVARDGRLLPLEVSARLMREEGRAVGVQAIARDIGERRRLEERLRQSQRFEAMGTLVAGVAHEVRNPLFAMAATLDAYEARFPGGGEFRRYVDALRTELDRLTVLMQDLLDFGRPPVVELRLGSLEDAVQDALRACASLEQRLGVSVQMRVESELPAVELDRLRLGQAIRNLVENALEHSPRGRAVTVRLRSAYLGDAPAAECVVEDAGPGFAAEDMPRVFEPFFTRRRGGTGLGLSIVQRIVEQHRGTVNLENRPGGGAAASLRLPGLFMRPSRPSS